MVKASRLRAAAMARAADLLGRAIDIDAASARLEPFIGRRHRADFWVDAEVRAAAFLLHGEGIWLHEALAAIEQRYGAGRRPSRSALHRCWQLLDKAKKAGWRLWD